MKDKSRQMEIGQLNLPVHATSPVGRDLMQHRQTAIGIDLRGDGGDDGGGGDEINLLDYWRIVVKRRWTVLGFLGIVVAIVLIATLLTPSTFRATSTLKIDRDTIRVVQVGGLTPAEAPNDQDFYQTQYELLKSRTLAKRVIGELDLAHNPVFQRMLQPSPLGRLLGMLRPTHRDASAGQASAAANEDTGRIDAFLGSLDIEPVRNSRLVRVQFTSLDPVFSAKVVNAIDQAFIATTLERRLDASSYAKTYLEDHLQELKVKLEDSEKDLAAFAEKEGIVDIGKGQSLISQQLQDISTALANAQEARIEAEANYDQLKSTSADALPQVLKSTVIDTLKQSRAELTAQYEDKLQILKPGFPTMQRLQSRIDEVDKQIASEVARIKGSVKSTYDSALANESMLQSKLDRLKAGMLDLQNRSIKYNIIQREVDTSRELYKGLLQRYKEVGLAGGVGTNNVSIVDRATPPTSRYKPNLTRNLGLAVPLGLFGGVLLALLFEHLDDTIKTPDDIERHFGLPLLGIIPSTRKSTPMVELENPRSGFAEAYRSVRTALQFSTEKGVPRTLLITSSGAGEGKTTTAVVLAQHFAQLGKRVLLIDADLRNPALHRLLDLDNSEGLTNYLAGEARPLASLRATRTQKLVCLCSGPLPPNPAELLAGPKMLSLLSLVDQRFDQIIIDGPPVLGIADAAILANMAAGTLLVVESGATRLGYARGMLRRLTMARARLLGVVLTKFDSRVASYGYGYGEPQYAYGEPAKRLARAP
ncbi:MAG TPA: polysaccharide biosynthesis tyrosine autokinase [Rhodanobacteraceae bacterium]|nr:polysaccharide biosynthesis tyrosine autokinase [Rhodanobacteraceae bacterium]